MVNLNLFPLLVYDGLRTLTFLFSRYLELRKIHGDLAPLLDVTLKPSRKAKVRVCYAKIELERQISVYQTTNDLKVFFFLNVMNYELCWTDLDSCLLRLHWNLSSGSQLRTWDSSTWIRNWKACLVGRRCDSHRNCCTLTTFRTEMKSMLTSSLPHLHHTPSQPIRRRPRRRHKNTILPTLPLPFYYTESISYPPPPIQLSVLVQPKRLFFLRN